VKLVELTVAVSVDRATATVFLADGCVVDAGVLKLVLFIWSAKIDGWKSERGCVKFGRREGEGGILHLAIVIAVCAIDCKTCCCALAVGTLEVVFADTGDECMGW